MRRLDDRYQIGARIGRGGVGEVFEGWQTALDRPVAIKILRPGLTRNKAAVARFEREARTTSRLHHPNVVTVFDVGAATNGARFVVMELLAGETLAERMHRDGAMPLGVVVHIARQIVRGMGAGQGVGLVHRDLKPENIFLLEGDHVKVLDFGLATLLDPAAYASVSGSSMETLSDALQVDPSLPDPDRAAGPTFLPEADSAVPDGEAVASGADPADLPGTPQDSAAKARLTRPGTLMGTPRYMAPEQVLGWNVDHRSDLYAFGCILYEMLAGRGPYAGPGARDFMRQHLHAEPAPLADVAPDCPRPFARMVSRLLAKSPDERFQDWAALAEALRQLSGTQIGRAGAPHAAAHEDAWPAEPYRFLGPFTAMQRTIFFGRDPDALRFREAWEHPDHPPMIVLTGTSGVGKTSFLAARVVPGLEDTGHVVTQVVGSSRPLDLLTSLSRRRLARLSDEDHQNRPLPQLLDAIGEHEGAPVCVVLDQLEEVFTLGDEEDAAALQAGVAAIVAGGDGRVRLLLSIREDYLGTLIRALQPLPMHQLSRTLPLRALGRDDLCEALVGPSREGLPVRYSPFTFEAGLVDEIVADLLDDRAGEVAPRVQAVGARLWDMVRHSPGAEVTREHYRTRLGGARGILGRILDEAISDLNPTDQGVAKELLRALTHLPGSPTSRPAPETELVQHAEDHERRTAVLRRLEDRWRIVQGFSDDRWPDERAYRIAHEALIGRIQQYGEEGTDRNRARQLFHQGLNLWLQGGRRDEDLLPEQHFDEVQGHIEDLVLRVEDERNFYADCLRVHNEGWMRRHIEARNRRISRYLQLTLIPAVLVALGMVLGQVPVDFVSFRVAYVQALTQLRFPEAPMADAQLRGADLGEAFLKRANLTGADLREADLRGAHLEEADLSGARADGALFDGAMLQAAQLVDVSLRGASLAGADLRRARLSGDRTGARFAGAVFNAKTDWGEQGPPDGALGPGGSAPGLEVPGARLSEVDMFQLSAPNANFSGAEMRKSAFVEAQLQQANLRGTDLSEANLGNVDLSRAMLEEANLSDAVLRGAVLSGAQLAGAKLIRADLTGANLEGTDLCGADLSSARTAGARFDGARACPTTRWPETGTPDGVTEAATLSAP